MEERLEGSPRKDRRCPVVGEKDDSRIDERGIRCSDDDEVWTEGMRWTFRRRETILKENA